MRFFLLWIRDFLGRHVATAVLLGLCLAGGVTLSVFAYSAAQKPPAPYTVQPFSSAAPSPSSASASVPPPSSVAVSSSASASTARPAPSRAPASSRPSVSAPYTPPQTVAVQRVTLQRPRTAEGVLRSGARMEADTNLSYLVAEIDVSVGDTVTAGQRLCQLDTTELDSEMALVRKAIANAQAQDAQALEQARQKLAEAEAKLAADESRLATLVQRALEALEAARHEEAMAIADEWTAVDAQEIARLVEITQNAYAAYEEARALIEQKYLDAESAGIVIMPDELEGDRMLLDILLDMVDTAQGNWDTAAALYREKWDNKYAEAYAQAKPPAQQQDYEQALINQATGLQEGHDAIAQAKSNVETQLAANSAATKEAELEKLLRQLEQMSVYAPLNGTVTEVNAQVGLLPSATRGGSALFIVQNLSQLAVEIMVPGDAIVLYSPGLFATVTLAALPGQSWQASVAAISPVAGAGGTFTVTMAFATPPQGLRAGTQVQLQFAGGAAGVQVLAAPENAVMLGTRGQSVAYLYTPPQAEGLRGSVREVSVQTAPASAGMLEITGGALKEGDLLVENAASYRASQSAYTTS